MLAIAVGVVVAACTGGHGGGTPTSSGSSSGSSTAGIHKIKHVVVIMQENRSFDNYFGTYPGADGIPMANGKPTVCVPTGTSAPCVRPYVDHADLNGGGPHDQADAIGDIDGGKMDGFIKRDNLAKKGCPITTDPACAHTNTPDVMSYHTGSDIPNYWAYAKNFVLQDHMFSSVNSWSLPAHLYLVSEWSALCTTQHDPSRCTNNAVNPGYPGHFGLPGPAIKAGTTGGAWPVYAWTDLTYLLHQNSVSWGYYVAAGDEPDCEIDSQLVCAPVHQDAATPGIWNPLPWFDTVRQDGQEDNIQSTDAFFKQAKSGKLPAVSWVVPSAADSEHPPSLVSRGQSWTTSLINTIMSGPDWNSTAIFLAWDDWGGFYDQVLPPVADQNGYGLRVPGMVISPYARQGFIDHQSVSFDAYIKFIEDDFLNGERIDPTTDGRPDPRIDVRENSKLLGDLTKDFDFTQKPRKPMLLPVRPKTSLTNSQPASN